VPNSGPTIVVMQWSGERVGSRAGRVGWRGMGEGASGRHDTGRRVTLGMCIVRDLALIPAFDLQVLPVSEWIFTGFLSHSKYV